MSSLVYKFRKCVFIYVTFLILIVSLVVFSLGVWSKMALPESEFDINELSSFNVPVVLIGFGSIIAITSILGIVGSLRENSGLLFLYLLVVGVSILAEAAGVISLYLLRENIFELLKKLVKSLFDKYDSRKEFENLMDIVQLGVKCCGINSYNDWNTKKEYMCSNNNSGPLKCRCPVSCCMVQYLNDVSCSANTLNERNPSISKIKIIGCADALKEFILSNMTLISIIFGCIIAWQFILYICVIVNKQHFTQAIGAINTLKRKNRRIRNSNMRNN